MLTSKFDRPRLPSYYYVWCEPPDKSGDELLYFVSERRRIKFKGHSFREFHQRVIPLLDGWRTIHQIKTEVMDVFAPEDLEDALELLAAQELLEDGPEEIAGSAWSEALTPQLNLFREIGLKPEQVQHRLKTATVTLLGLGGAGSQVAAGLASSGVGAVRCADALPITASDVYFSPIFSVGDCGALRTEVTARRLRALAPSLEVSTHIEAIESDEQVSSLINGSDFVVCCVDAGQSSLSYRVNRACLKSGTRWTSCALMGTEVIIGPMVYPFHTACYLCYKMRSVACARNPEDSFAFEQFLDRRKRDDSGHRENLVFGAGIAANMLGLEVLKELSGIVAPTTRGSIVVVDLLELSVSRHAVLRKPWCPACFRVDERESGREGPQIGEQSNI
jgi:bacteriocin biosynthesis cyclodehydratase domain-containing protein